MCASSVFIPIVPAGGSGTRLWPLSRRSEPKFLLDLTGTGSSLLQQTLRRLEPIADHPPIIVTGAVHRDAVTTQAQAVAAGADRRARILAEPSPKNSMPAIAWAAAVAERIDEDAVIGSFAADHLIHDVDGFTATIRAAHRAAELGHLVTIGIEPTYPATGFGYIQEADGTPEQLGAAGARAVARFVEKPDAETAQSFLAAGGFTWNAGMFVARASLILHWLDRLLPQVADAARQLARLGQEHVGPEEIDRIWQGMTSIAIDHALAEPLAAEGAVAMVPARFDWDDVGDFHALSRQLRSARPAAQQGHHDATPAGSAVQQGSGGAGSDVVALGDAPVIADASRASIYSRTGRPVAVVGLEDITVVDTEDVLLVLADDHAQSLSGLVANLEEHGQGHLR